MVGALVLPSGKSQLVCAGPGLLQPRRGLDGVWIAAQAALREGSMIPRCPLLS